MTRFKTNRPYRLDHHDGARRPVRLPVRKNDVMANSNEGMSLIVGRMLGGGFRELSSNC
jgi:hypothetical protein